VTRAGEDLKQAAARKGSFGQTFKAVAWSFFGVRKSSEYEKDITQLNPLHVILAGIAAAAAFVVTLVMLVKWVVGSGVAG
jgi:Protein of unknown function (DUF2970)